MANDLDDVRARLDYCEEETAQLRDAIKAYLAEAVEFRKEPSADNYVTHLQARLLRPIPIPIRAKMGMIANETRASLDDLAGTLAIRNNKSPKSTKFPVAADDTSFQEVGRKMIKALSDADKRIIADMQPCKEKRPLLYALHQLDISRKHGKLVVHAAGLDGFGVVPLENQLEIEHFGPVEPYPDLNEEWQRVYTIRALNRVRIIPNNQLVLQDQPIVSGQEAISTLTSFIQEARSVVAQFN